VKEKEGLEIRYTRPMDSGYLKEWITNPQVASRMSMTDQTEVDFALKSWMFYARFQSSLTATVNHTPCGIATLFLMPYKKVKHHSSFKICVDPKRWREGIGSSLIKNIKHLALTYFDLDAIHTELFGDNPLIDLLKTFDFKEFVKQEKYVKTEEGYLSRTCLICELKKGGKSEAKT
jgi:RimJ/RimL family protein N-acetyltransferase